MSLCVYADVSLCTSALDALLEVYSLRLEFELARDSTALARMQSCMRNRTINIIKWSEAFNLFGTCLSAEIEAMWNGCLRNPADWNHAFDGNHDPRSLRLDLTAGFLYNSLSYFLQKEWHELWFFMQKQTEETFKVSQWQMGIWWIRFSKTEVNKQL